MFFDELTPIFKEFVQQPIAFLGGFVSGILRLDLNEDPVRSWLDQQAGSANSTVTTTEEAKEKSNSPQSISID